LSFCTPSRTGLGGDLLSLIASIPTQYRKADGAAAFIVIAKGVGFPRVLFDFSQRPIPQRAARRSQ
jgi:hypothetical protein